MPSTAIIAVAAAVAACVALVVWMRSRRSSDPQLPLIINGFALIRFNKNQMTREDARNKCIELQAIYVAVRAELIRIYGSEMDCLIDTITLDNDYHKPAEWTGIAARKLTVNPSKTKHRSHFAEEIHNLYRFERYGMQHIYDPINDDDSALRERAQGYCRKV